MQYISLSTCVIFYNTNMKVENYGNFLEKLVGNFPQFSGKI